MVSTQGLFTHLFWCFGPYHTVCDCKLNLQPSNVPLLFNVLIYFFKFYNVFVCPIWWRSLSCIVWIKVLYIWIFVIIIVIIIPRTFRTDEDEWCRPWDTAESTGAREWLDLEWKLLKVAETAVSEIKNEFCGSTFNPTGTRSPKPAQSNQVFQHLQFHNSWLKSVCG